MNQTPSPETVIRRAIESVMRRTSTAEPGVIESFDPATSTADVQPLVLQIARDDSGERVTKRKPVVNVPVLFVGGGGSRLTFPVRRGDTCLLVAASVPIDNWKAIGGEIDPISNRHHHITDSIAIVGLTDAAHAAPVSSTATVLEGNDVRLGDASGAQLLALKSDVDELRSVLASHTHLVSGITAGGASVTSAVGVPTPGAMVGTTKTRAS